MIIVSQNKTKMIKYKEVEEINVKENNVCVFFKSGRESVIGTYNTPDAAISVLSDLITAIDEKDMFSFGNSQTNIYKMP